MIFVLTRLQTNWASVDLGRGGEYYRAPVFSPWAIVIFSNWRTRDFGRLLAGDFDRSSQAKALNSKKRSHFTLLASIPRRRSASLNFFLAGEVAHEST
ncbi:MAG: hypothetical protein MZW92_74300 [Comamonadaceae bacterium]|nr:hypothetical protein [Comamonadaceae bacterium]